MTPLLVLIQSIFYQNNHLNEKLKSIYQKIQKLDQAARKTTKTKELTALTDVTKELVFLEHTLEDQAETISDFCHYLESTNLANKQLIDHLKTQQRRRHPWKKQLFRIQFYRCVCKYPNNYLQYSIKIQKI